MLSTDQAAILLALQVAAFSTLDSGGIEPEGSEGSQDESSEESLEGTSRAGSQHYVIDMPGRQKSQVRPEQHVLALLTLIEVLSLLVWRSFTRLAPLSSIMKHSAL